MRHAACLNLVIAISFLWPSYLAAERKAVTIKSVTTQNGSVDIELDVEGQPGEMDCPVGYTGCIAPHPGRYVMATDETGGYTDCVDDVALFPASSHFSDGEKIGVYCLLSPAREPISCPVVLTDPHTVNASYPWVNMSVKNTSDKVVTAITIRYASISAAGLFTTSPQRLAISQNIPPHQSFVFSTIAASEKILEHQQKSNGVGTAYFLDDVQFADSTEWKADPADHACGTMGELVERGLAAPEPLPSATSPSLR